MMHGRQPAIVFIRLFQVLYVRFASHLKYKNTQENIPFYRLQTLMKKMQASLTVKTCIRVEMRMSRAKGNCMHAMKWFEHEIIQLFALCNEHRLTELELICAYFFILVT